MEELFAGISLAEDCVDYFLIPTQPETHDSSYLESLKDDVLSTIQPYIENYLWNHNEFQLYCDCISEGAI